MGLIVEGLEVSVGTFRASLKQLDVASGELACFMGRSGSGKSTLLLAISGFVSSTGSIHVNEIDVSMLPPERRQITITFQKAALFSHLSVLENVEFGLKVQGIPRAKRSTLAHEWLNRLSISDLTGRATSQISEGQAQRVALARALAVGFPVLLLDEPFSALDVETRRDLRQLVRQLLRETKVSAVMVTHHPEDALAMADSLYLMENGSVTCLGSPEDARKSTAPAVAALLRSS